MKTIKSQILKKSGLYHTVLSEVQKYEKGQVLWLMHGKTDKLNEMPIRIYWIEGELSL